MYDVSLCTCMCGVHGVSVLCVALVVYGVSVSGVCVMFVVCGVGMSDVRGVWC